MINKFNLLIFFIGIIIINIFLFVGGGYTFAASEEEGQRYFIKSTNIFWQKALEARHIFDNGFSADLSGLQLRIAKVFGLEIEKVDKLHISPIFLSNLGTDDSQINQYKDLEDVKNVKKLARSTKRAFLPSDQTPWGIETIYNDRTISATSGGAGVNVAVLDTGVFKNHPDLVQRIKECKDFTNPKIPLRDGSCEDKNGHGTHIAGIILADGGSDGLGIYGIAPEAKLYAYKVCGNDGSCWADDVAYGIIIASDNGANIINLSLGSDIDNSLVRDAINYAVSKDVLIIAAGGNDGPYFGSIDYPAANPNVIGVGAIDISISVPEWSARGINSTTTPFLVEEKDMEFSSPGVNIESTWKNGGYAILSGTSMSAPHISGLAAKFWKFDALKGEQSSATREFLHQLAKDIWLAGDDDATGLGLPTL